LCVSSKEGEISMRTKVVIRTKMASEKSILKECLLYDDLSVM